MATETIKEYLVALGVDPDSEALARWDDGIQRAKRHMMDLAQVASGLAAGVGTVGAALVTNSVQTSKYAKETLRAADALGVTAEEFQRVNAAAKRFGADGAEDTRDLLSVLTDRADEAAAGMATYEKQFERLGIQAEELEGLSPDEILKRTAEGFQEVSDKQGVVAAERLLGGDLGQRFLPLLQQGAEGIERLGDRSESLGVILDEKVLTQSKEFGQSWKDLTELFEGFRRLLGAKLAPELDDLIERFRSWMRANKGLVQQRIDQFAQDAGDAFQRLGDALAELDAVAQEHGGWVPFLEMIFTWSKRILMLWAGAKIVMTVQALAGAFGQLGTVVGQLTGGGMASALKSSWLVPFAAIAAAVYGLTRLLDELVAYVEGGESIFGAIAAGGEQAVGALMELGEILAWLAGGIATLVWWFGAASAAVAAGSAAAVVAVGLAVAAIIAYWDEIVAFFGRTWDWLTSSAVGVWDTIVGAAQNAWDGIVSGAKSAVQDIIAWFGNGKDAITGLWDDIANYIARKIDQMLGWLADFGQEAASWFGFGPGPGQGPGGRPAAGARPAAAGGGQTNVRTGDTEINVETKPGQDEEEIARRVEKKRREEERKKHRKAAEKLARGSEQ